MASGASWANLNFPMVFRLEHGRRNTALRDGLFIIGRIPECDLTLNHASVSRRHAVIDISGSTATIRDLGSRNGVRINGRRVMGTCTLVAGDVITVGNVELVVQSSGGPQFTTVDHRPSTSSETSISLLYELAEKALAVGWGEEAERLLSIHLGSTLKAVGSGRPMPREQCDTAALWAARIATATGHTCWFEFPMRLFVHLARPLPPPAVEELCRSVQHVREIDDSLVTHYLTLLEETLNPAIAAHGAALARMRKLHRCVVERQQRHTAEVATEDGCGTPSSELSPSPFRAPGESAAP